MWNQKRCAVGDSLAIVRKLQAAGYDHTTTNDQRRTALHCAAINDHIEVFRHLQSSASAGSEDRFRCTSDLTHEKGDKHATCRPE
ncbi:hypothetical protein QTI24_20870 [Variovorax sp. J22P240]|uniref:hypothetical protein n=1 Tax=Variovorax sp. J22P240 TaxID=3053514 RepID=UPI0025751114|nr:hypothetical protein [Variovorax sp. J22P240]MDM0001075.1 hypothetical protein [Variovorax sp. J22P240]